MLIFGKNNAINWIKMVFTIVPIPTESIGITIPEIIIVSEKKPAI